MRTLDNFCAEMEAYRLILLVGLILLQGCILIPATILVISFYDIGLGNASIIILAIGSFSVLVTNMAEASIKSVLITSALSFIASIAIIAVHLLLS